MPISRSGKLYFSPAQVEAARACSALEYARSAGYDLVREGASRYRLREHDSMVFTSDGRWFWNSQNLRGRAIEFIMYYEHCSFPVAVHKLISGCAVSPAASSAPAPLLDEENKPFELPEKSPTFKRLFAYLCNTRALDPEIIQELVRQKRVYESVRQYRCAKTGELRTAHNAVFVGVDEEGYPRNAFQRGTNTAASFKRDVAGSDKKYAFCCPGRPDVAKVSVFEAAIDAISHATLAKFKGLDWRDRDRIALGGVAARALLHYLKFHPQIRQVELCLDNDAAGLKAVDDLVAALQSAGYDAEHGYVIRASFPPAEYVKDWNEYLMAVRQGRENKKTPLEEMQEMNEEPEL